MTEPTSTYRVRSEESHSIAVIRAVAEEHGVDPVDLDVCLYDHIDPGAFDTLLEDRSKDSVLYVTFEMANCVIMVDSEGAIEITRSFTGGSPTETNAISTS